MSAAAYTGTLRVVCDRCGVGMGTKPCLPENDGKVSHSKCPACVAVFLQELESFPSAPRKLGAAELAKVCGMAEGRLVELCPHQVLWGVEALTDLVGLLAVSGEKSGAARLMRWLVAGSDEFTAGCGAPESDSVARFAHRTSPMPARESAQKRSWWHRWEGEHA